MVKSKNTLGSDVSVRNMIQVPENINRNSRETIIYTFFKENVFFILITYPHISGSIDCFYITMPAGFDFLSESADGSIYGSITYKVFGEIPEMLKKLIPF